MWPIFNSLVFILAIVVSLCIFSGIRSYNEGKSLEKQGKYKEACYEYAYGIGGLTNILSRKCKERLIYLWEKYHQITSNSSSLGGLLTFICPFCNFTRFAFSRESCDFLLLCILLTNAFPVLDNW